MPDNKIDEKIKFRKNIAEVIYSKELENPLKVLELEAIVKQVISEALPKPDDLMFLGNERRVAWYRTQFLKNLKEQGIII